MEWWMFGVWYAVGLVGSREIAAQFVKDMNRGRRGVDGGDLAVAVMMFLVAAMTGPVAFVAGLGFKANRYLKAHPRKSGVVKKWVQWFFTADRAERKKVLNDA